MDVMSNPYGKPGAGLGAPRGRGLLLDPRRPIGLSAALMDGSDPRTESLVLTGASARRAVFPRVVAASRDAQRLTHQAYFEEVPMGVHEAELQSLSSAK